MSSFLRIRPAARTLVATQMSVIGRFYSSIRLLPPQHLNEKEAAIFIKLRDALEPERLEVQDVSGGCGSMYAIEITSAAFKGLGMIKQHRLVNGVLAEEIKEWHGMQLRTKVPPAS